ncbi:MAG: hypothetical protein KC800_02285 [Candidatus Eremiobacteraeota bacterium]|nr:hypothetical protein [Candidatus Eremiobacteraeota bacterium]
MDERFYKQSDALLTAFDQVANSNSHLLRAPKEEGNLKERFQRYVASECFEKALRESDLQRDWENLHTHDENCNPVPLPGRCYTGDPVKFLEPLGPEEFRSELKQRLNSGPCWYDTRYPESEVSRVVDEFLEYFPVDGVVMPVAPDFLFLVDGTRFGETQDEPKPGVSEPLGFFDGCGADVCRTWLSNDRLLVLLLNGSS